MAFRRSTHKRLDSDVLDDVEAGEEQAAKALTAVLELGGWPVRLSIDKDQLTWSPAGGSGSATDCLPLPSTYSRHAAGCPATRQSPDARRGQQPGKSTVPVTNILSATVGEPSVHATPSCCTPSSRFTTHRLVLHTVKRQRWHRAVWRRVDVVFESMSQEVVRDWAGAINARVSALPDRPMRLLVIINPYGGERKARAVWERLHRGVFAPAGVKCEVVETQRAGHAMQVLACLTHGQLAGLDGVVAVGGDGLFHEVVNGIMAVREGGGERALRAAHLRVGHVPAGSTDATSFSLHGTRDETTAALHVALGDRTALDVLRVDCEGEGSHRFAVTMAAYGYLGDLMRESEGLRWLGPLRYDLAGARSLLRGKTYRARLQYLPAEVQNSELKQLCGVNCAVCKRFRENPAASSDFTANAADALQLTPERWVSVEDSFVAVMVLLPTCRNNKSLRGVAPHNHLSDGKALLVAVRECSPMQYFKFLLDLSKSGAIRGRFPYVDVLDVHAVRLTPLGEQSSWNVDGELLVDNRLAAQVHGALIDVFARGPEIRP